MKTFSKVFYSAKLSKLNLHYQVEVQICIQIIVPLVDNLSSSCENLRVIKRTTKNVHLNVYVWLELK